MNIDTISEKIRTHIIEEFVDTEDTATFTDDTALVSSGLIDSISILQVVDFLEQTFSMEFEPHEVDQINLNTVNLMVAFVQSKLS